MDSFLSDRKHEVSVAVYCLFYRIQILLNAQTYNIYCNNYFSRFIRSTIKERSEEFIAKLTMANVGHRPLIWVGHSMGGLLVKKMLVEGNK